MIPQSEKCETKQKMTKQIKIARCPEVLILHLKRFSSKNDKNDSKINFPDYLKVKNTGFQLTRFGLLVRLGWTV